MSACCTACVSVSGCTFESVHLSQPVSVKLDSASIVGLTHHDDDDDDADDDAELSLQIRTAAAAVLSTNFDYKASSSVIGACTRLKVIA